MPVLDPAAIAGIISDLIVNILSYAGIAALLYAIGGILIRTIGWTFDKLLVSFIGTFYKYFETIIDGTLLTDTVVKGMMDRVYLLVGVFVAFRLGMLLVNYIINPSEVMDEKVGVNALIKRVIIGLILIIFMPTIFNYAFRLQNAILDDQVIERVIMSDAEIKKVETYKEKHGMGKIIGMTAFRGFFSLSANASSNKTIKTNFEKATEIDQLYDLSVIDQLGSGLEGGILYKVGNDYAHDYFPIFSTVILCYVLYLLVQYCLDAVVRSFKLVVLQVIAPICIVEYMINGDRNEVFKSWRKAVISTFAMLFMRVASIWFVAYVTMLMQPGMIDGKSLLQSQDNLLKAVIVLGLLAFMMDFPKMMSDVFGLDLDQSGAVKNVMGKALGAATAGLALGGAAVGALGKPMKSVTRAGLSGVGNAGKSLVSSIGNSKTFGNLKSGLAKSKLGQAASKTTAAIGNKLGAAKTSIANSGIGRAATKVANSKTMGELKKAGSAGLTAATKVAKDEHLGTALKTGAVALGGAVLASNQFTKSAASGYQQASSEHSKDKQQQIQAATDQMQANMASNISQLTQQMNFQATVDLAARIRATGVDAASLPTAVVNAQIAANPQIPNMTANVSASFDAISGSPGGAVSSAREAQQVITAELSNAGVSSETIVQVNNDIQQTYASGGSVSSADAQRLVQDAYRREYTPQAEQASKLVP